MSDLLQEDGFSIPDDGDWSFEDSDISFEYDFYNGEIIGFRMSKGMALYPWPKKSWIERMVDKVLQFFKVKWKHV